MVQFYSEDTAAGEQALNLVQSFSGAVAALVMSAQVNLTESFHSASDFLEQQAAIAELRLSVEELKETLVHAKQMLDEGTDKLAATFREQELREEMDAMSDEQLVAEFESYGVASPEELAAIRYDLGLETDVPVEEPTLNEAETAMVEKALQQDELIEAAIESNTPPDIKDIDPFLMTDEQLAALGELQSQNGFGLPYSLDLQYYKQTLEEAHSMAQDMLVQQGLEGGAPLNSMEDVQASLEQALATSQNYDPSADEGIFGISGIEELTSSENMYEYGQMYFKLLSTNPEMADTLKAVMDQNTLNAVRRGVYEETGINYNDLTPVQRNDIDMMLGYSSAEEMTATVGAYVDELKSQGLTQQEAYDQIIGELNSNLDNNLTSEALDAQWDVTDNMQYGDGYGRILDQAATDLDGIPYEMMGHEEQLTNTLQTVAGFGNHTAETFMRDMRGNLEGQGLSSEVVDRMEQQIQTYLGDDMHQSLSPEDVSDLVTVISDDVYNAGDAAREFLDTYDPQDMPDTGADAANDQGLLIPDINGNSITVDPPPGFKP